VAHGRCKKTKNRIAARGCSTPCQSREMAKTGVDANERNCGPAHLRQSAFLHSYARFAGRVGRIPVPNKGMRDENRLANLVPKIMASNEIQPIACDALLCAGLAFGGYAKPVLEQVLRSIRKLAAEPTETVGWLRAWAVCAPARHKPPRGGASGERPEERPLLCFDGERCTIFHNENRHTTQITTPMV
jgi:hypothetical protein